MKKVFYLLLISISIGCKTARYNFVKETGCTAIFTFEKAKIESEEYYFFKSKKIIFNNQELDVEDYFPLESQLNIQINEIIHKKYPKKYWGFFDKTSITNCNYFSKKDVIGDIHFSDYIYFKNNNIDRLYLIYAIHGDIVKLLECDSSGISRLNHRYSCPVEEDLLNVPFYVVTKINNFSPPSNDFLSIKGYEKFELDSFRINYCD